MERNTALSQPTFNSQVKNGFWVFVGGAVAIGLVIGAFIAMLVAFLCPPFRRWLEQYIPDTSQ